MLQFLLLPFSLLCLLVSAEDPVVETENGPVSGTWKLSTSGNRYRAFEGIPYAKPPVGDNRFKPPEKLDGKWIGVWNAKKVPNACMQLDHFLREELSNGSTKYHVRGDEDCLYLNLYSSEDGPPKKAVVIHIHGGAFMFGDGSIYGEKHIMDRNDIIFVNINYRLGPLGFFTTGDAVVPGNNGLKDQQAALQWVQRNIAQFGGDPERIMMSGNSAGGASVMYHTLSSLKEDIIKGGILFSGASICPWAFVENGVERSKQLASLVGCPTTDSKSMVKCLRRRPATQIVEKVQDFMVWLYNPFTVFGPVVEHAGSNPFLVDTPHNLLREGKFKNIPLLFGVTTEESLYPGADFYGEPELIEQLNDNWETIAPALLFPRPNIKSLSKIAQKARSEYLGSEPITEKNIKKVIDLMSDRVFVAPAVEAAQTVASFNKQPVYFYSYGFKSKTTFSDFITAKKFPGVAHGDDVLYYVSVSVRTDLDERETVFAKKFRDLLYNFITTGKVPSYWKPVDDGKKLNYLDIKSTDEFVMKSDNSLGNIKKIKNIFLEDALLNKDEL